MGNGRNTVSRVLFRKTELGESCDKLSEFCDKHANHRPRDWARNSVRAKNSLSSVFETVLSETVFGPFPTETCLFAELCVHLMEDYPFFSGFRRDRDACCFASLPWLCQEHQRQADQALFMQKTCLHQIRRKSYFWAHGKWLHTHTRNSASQVWFLMCNGLHENIGQCFGNPNPYDLQYTSNLYGSTPPICIAVLSWLLSFEEREPCSTPPICTAIRLPFVRQYAPHLYGSTFGKILGVGVTGTFLNNLRNEPNITVSTGWIT